MSECASVSTVLRRIAELDELPDGSVVMGVDHQNTIRFKSSGQWLDSKKPVGSTWSLNTYILARRWGVRVLFLPEM